MILHSSACEHFPNFMKTSLLSQKHSQQNIHPDWDQNINTRIPNTIYSLVSGLWIKKKNFNQASTFSNNTQ